MSRPHDFTPLLEYLNNWLPDYLIVTDQSNSRRSLSLFLSWPVTPVKVDRPLFYVDIAVISYDGAYHIQFYPGAADDNIREIIKTLAHYKEQ